MSNPPPVTGFSSFLAELKRRHVVRAALAYAAVVFVALQAAEIILPAFLPTGRADGALRVLVVALALLFPVVLVLAWVYEITPQGVRAMAALDAEAGHVPAGRLLPRVALLLVTVLAAGGAGLWWYRTDLGASEGDRARRSAPATAFVPAATTDASGPIRSLAVLPLENFSSQEGVEPDYFAAGMHEALVSQLSQLSSVRVISRTSSAQVDRRGKSLPQIGAELGVDAVVEGSVLRADDRVRITVQLIHAASDTHLWARDYERDLVDVISLQREVAEAIAAEIQTRLAQRGTESGGPEPASGTAADHLAAVDEPPPATTDRTPTSPTVRAVPPAPAAPDVQDAVFRGRFALNLESPDQLSEARRHFQEALRLDSSYAPALVGLAGTRLVEGLAGSGGSLSDLLDAHRLATLALEQDPASTEAVEVLGSVEQALSTYGERMERRGADLDGRVHVVHASGDSMLLVVEGDTVRVGAASVGPMATEIGSMMQVVLARDDAEEGLAVGWLRGIARLEAAGRLDEAREQARTAVERFPDQAAPLSELERLQALTGQFDQAVSSFALREQRFGSAPGPNADEVREAFRQEGAEAYWRARLSSIRAERAAGRNVSWVLEAEALTALGRPDEAFAALDRARQTRDSRLASLRRGPLWDVLRADPRFERLQRGLRTP